MIRKEAFTASRPLLGAVLLAGVLVLALGVRLHGLDRASFWGDEAHTANRGERLRTVVIDKRCAPLYVVTFVAFLFGKGETLARLPHALAGAASIYLLYRLGSAHLGARTGLLAAFLLAISPLHVHHSRDARFYSLMVFLTLFSLHSVERAVRGGSRAWLLVFAGTSVLNIHNHPFAAIPTAAFCLYGIWAWRRERSPPPARAAGATAGAEQAEALAASASERTRWQTGALRATLLLAGGAAVVYILRPGIWRSLFTRIAGEGAGRFDLDLDMEFLESALIWFGAGPGLILAVYVSCFACGTVVLALRSRQTFVLAAIVFALTSTALQLAIWISLSHPFHLRYVIYLLPFYLLVVAAGAEAIAAWIAAGAAAALMRVAGGRRPALAGPWAWALPLLGAAAFFAAIVAPALVSYQRYQFADYRGAVALLLQLAAPGDAIALPAYRVQGHAAGLRWYLRQDRPGARAPFVVSSSEEAEALAASHGRLWLVEVVPAGLSPGSAGLDVWAAERLDEAGRIPHKIWSDRLEPPRVMEEIVIRRLGPR